MILTGERMQRWQRKSFKREIASAALLFWALITIRVFFGLPVDLVTALNGAYGSLSFSVWTFALGAFGLDAYLKREKTE